MKSIALFLITFIILLTGFFSNITPPTTGHAVSVATSHGLSGRAFTTPYDDTSGWEALSQLPPTPEQYPRRAYLLNTVGGTASRGRNPFLSLISYSPFTQDYKTKIGSKPTQETYRETDKGDLDSDGDIDIDDLLYLSQAVQKGGKSLQDNTRWMNTCSTTSTSTSFYSRRCAAPGINIKAGDMNFDGVISREDLQLMESVVKQLSLRQHEGGFAFIESCEQEGSYTNAKGEKCTCTTNKQETCAPPPAGHTWIQRQHGEVDLRPIFYG